jgi:hypothetical protein
MCNLQSEPAKTHTCRLAIASLVLALLFPVLGILLGLLLSIFGIFLAELLISQLSPSLHALLWLLICPIALILGIASLIGVAGSYGALRGSGKSLAVAGITILLVSGLLALLLATAVVDYVPMSYDESAAISGLKTFAQQETAFRDQKQVDQDDNGVGEYGLLGEMAGELALRPSTKGVANPAYITQQLQTGGNKGKGFAMKSGYYFRIYLSNAASQGPTGTGDDRTLGGDASKGGPAAAAEAIRLQESCFALYAWPVELHSTGSRAFFVNQVGQVYATKMEAKTYDGENAMPAANAAYIRGCDVFRSPVSWGTTPGNDGNQWFPVQ